MIGFIDLEAVTKTVSDITASAKSFQSSGSTTQKSFAVPVAQQSALPPSQPSPTKSNTIIIVLGATAIVGTIAYLIATRKKKK